MEAIHDVAKKSTPLRKRICLGGGRVSGRSRENLISSLISRAALIQQRPLEVTPRNEESDAPREMQESQGYDLYDAARRAGEPLPYDYVRPTRRAGQSPPSEAASPTTRGWVSRSIEQDLRRYTEIHAESEAASTHLRATLANSAPAGRQAATAELPPPQATVSQQPAPSQSAVVAGTAAAQPAATNQIVAPTTIPTRERLEVDVAPTTIPTRERLEVDVAVTTIPTHERLEVEVAPTSIRQLSGDEVVVAHAAVAQDVSSRPIHPTSSTQSVSSMLRSFAFEDTSSGYYDD